MEKDTLRMQFLSGVITESEYTAIINQEIEDTEKDSLNESMIGGIVGIGAINQIPATPKTDYELAFEHYLGEKYGLNEVEIEKAKIEEGVFGDLLSRMENNTRMAADIFTVIALAKKDKEGNADKAVELLMKNHDLSEEEAIEAVTRIFKKAFEWADTMEEGKEDETSDMEAKVEDEISMNEAEGGNEVEEFLNDLINTSIPEDSEEGEEVTGVWEASEYADEDAYDDAQEFTNTHKYITDQGGEITIEGNPDVTYTALPNGDIQYSLIVTLN